MMFIKLLGTRRSIRKFKDQPLEQGKIDKLVEAALRSFSSRGFNPWRFIVVNDPALMDRLSAAKSHGSSFLKNAPLGIVVYADPAVSDVWVEDTAITSAFIHLAAHDMGLGSCWIQIRKREHSALKNADTYVKEVLNIPDNLSIESIIAIGYPDETKKGHSEASLPSEKVTYNGFDTKD